MEDKTKTPKHKFQPGQYIKVWINTQAITGHGKVREVTYYDPSRKWSYIIDWEKIVSNREEMSNTRIFPILPIAQVDEWGEVDKARTVLFGESKDDVRSR